MATIAFDKIINGAVLTTKQTLDTTNDFLFKAGSRQVIVLENNTGGEANVTMVGDEAPTSVSCPGLALDVDASTGYQFTIQDGETFSIAPESINVYLKDSTNQPSLNVDVAGVVATALEL